MASLRDLVVNEQEFDQAAVADALMPFVRLSGAGEMRPADGWGSLPQRSKVLTTLLAYRAAFAMEMRPSPAAGPAEIARATNINPGTVRPALRDLADLRVVQQDPEGAYFVPPMQVPAALRLVQGQRAVDGK